MHENGEKIGQIEAEISSLPISSSKDTLLHELQAVKNHSECFNETMHSLMNQLEPSIQDRTHRACKPHLRDISSKLEFTLKREIDKLFQFVLDELECVLNTHEHPDESLNSVKSLMESGVSNIHSSLPSKIEHSLGNVQSQIYMSIEKEYLSLMNQVKAFISDSIYNSINNISTKVKIKTESNIQRSSPSIPISRPVSHPSLIQKPQLPAKPRPVTVALTSNPNLSGYVEFTETSPKGDESSELILQTAFHQNVSALEAHSSTTIPADLHAAQQSIATHELGEAQNVQLTTPSSTATYDPVDTPEKVEEKMDNNKKKGGFMSMLGNLTKSRPKMARKGQLKSEEENVNNFVHFHFLNYNYRTRIWPKWIVETRLSEPL
jgi:hypothetical protein